MDALPASATSADPQHLVLDSAVFITASAVPVLQRFFSAGAELVTIAEVLDEIRDAAARARLQALPFRICTRAPSSEALAAVARFARETGDLGVLSMTDLKVMALTYDLEVEHHGTERIRSHPKSKRPILPGGRAVRRVPTPSADVVDQGAKSLVEETPGRSVALSQECDDQPAAPIVDEALDGEPIVADNDDEVSDLPDPATDSDSAPVDDLSSALHDVSLEEDTRDLDEGAVDDDGDGEWITVANLHHRQRPVGRRHAPRPALPPSSSSSVACMTTDFAMQNVLVQMGLRLASLDGRTITNVAQWVLRCCACLKMTLELERVFCPSCGGQALTRSRVKVTSGGWIKYRHSAPRPASLRGTIYSIPKPKGGRKNSDLILREDQLLKVAPKTKKKGGDDLFEEASEFAWRKTTASFRQHVGHPRGRRVNEPLKKTGKRKQRR